jgi:hypothetical protein
MCMSLLPQSAFPPANPTSALAGECSCCAGLRPFRGLGACVVYVPIREHCLLSSWLRAVRRPLFMDSTPGVLDRVPAVSSAPDAPLPAMLAYDPCTPAV